jgi:uncharacterized protein
MVKWQYDSVGSVYNYLSLGCQICRQGAGLVLFITGKCDRGCFYCPLSLERKDKDVVFADEQEVQNMDDILEEARAIGALGTGITGGEPLLKLDYLLMCLQTLKQEFGPEHHIHLYTGLLPNQSLLRKLTVAGLDEIRFHPPIAEWSRPDGLKEALKAAKSLGIEAGVEIPAINAAPKIIEALRDTDSFLNINELEFSETNFSGLKDSGFIPHDLGCEAIGSREIAKEHFLLDDLKVHYCPSRFKDAVQLRERLKRRANRTMRPFDYVSDEGTIVHGIIEGDLKKALQILFDLGVPEEMFLCKDLQIEIAASILEDISQELKDIDCILSIIEKYPLDDGLIVERIPL